MRARRVAAVDMGSNSTRLLVADVAEGVLRERLRRLQITRLAEGVDRERRLGDEPMRRTLAVVSSYAEEARADGAERFLLTATSAVRDAANGGEFLARIRGETGFDTRLLSGGEEAETTFRGVLTGRSGFSGPTVVIDVGGGSTEVAIGDAGGLGQHVSVDAGAVRATERWLVEGPVPLERIARARQALAEQFAREVPASARDAEAGLAVAGTATTLAAIDLGLAEYDADRVHGHVLTRAAIEDVLHRLAPMTIEQRRAVPGLEPARAPTIVGGIAVLSVALDTIGLDAVETSDRDILHGVALLAAEA